MGADERKARNKAYYEANKETIKRKRKEALLVPSIRDAINRRRREQYAAKRQEDCLVGLPTVKVLSLPRGADPPTVNRDAGVHIFDASIGRRRQSARLPPHDERTLILPRAAACRYCGAYKFYKETAHFCCSAGQVSIASHILPQYLVGLLTGQDDDSKDFRSMLRTYNNHFAYSSMSIHCDARYEKRNNGIYTVRAQGQIHHFLNDLFPSTSSAKMSGLQFYFYDPVEQVAARTSALPRLRSSTVVALVEVMEPNPYSTFLRTLSTLEELDQYCIIIKTDSTLDQRVYNKPTTTEVAGIWIEDESGQARSYDRDIRVYTRAGHSYNIQYYYACYDPLQYVLMFPAGEPGWHGNIPTVGSVLVESSSASIPNATTLNNQQPSSVDDLLAGEMEGHRRANKRYKQGDSFGSGSIVRTNKRSTVSCRQYYAYKLQIRVGDRSYLLRFGRLLQQYVVDMYIKIESMRLAYFEKNQDKLRVEYYKGVMDSVVAGVQKGGRVGSRVYLPPTFIGGPRDMRHRFLDSMSLVQEFGRPDIFFTITCNSNWPEITECLAPGEEVQNRPDLVVRVFKAKLSILQDRIMKDKFFGEVASMVHVIEFQKRGLPHAHFLIILKPSSKLLTPEAYDRFVSAELPDKEADPYLYSLVVKHMMHGPCGDLNPENVCMRDAKCKNRYPKQFENYTIHGKGSYPIYRRRNDGRSAMVRGQVLDNRWVVPYNQALLAEFNCHCNIEICCDIRVVKYLYKYVHKGHDRVAFRIAPDSSGNGVNEIDNFRNARWVSPPESVWRIYGFPLSGMYPAVLQLQVHLPNFQTVRFEDDADLESLLRDERFKRSMLTEFFRMNNTDPEAQRLDCLYKNFPSYYVWDSTKRIWTTRKRGVVIGRMCTVNPCEDGRYYLRVLLLNVRCPKSFQDLLTVDGVLCETYQAAAYMRGLLHQDDDIDKCMEEASMSQMPVQLRMLFATLLYYCKPSKPQELFTKFLSCMSDDFLKDKERLGYTEQDIIHKVLFGINDTLKSLGKQVDDYHIVPYPFTLTDSEQRTREISSELSLPIPDEDIRALDELNEQQRGAFDVIFNQAINGSGGAFFVDGPGGTGKSFMYRVLLAHLRARGFIALIVATSGIASSCFLGGRTAHSRFKIPIDISAGVKCQVPFQSGEAYLIRNSRIIIWDEAPMAHTVVIEALDKLLRDLCENDTLFGGTLVVFGGDFRQVLPVVRGGSRAQ